jgi:hypothetical protein
LQKIHDMEAAREDMLRRHAAERGKVYTPQVWRRPAKGERCYAGLYQYWRLMDDADRYKRRMCELETQIDKLKFFVVPK